MRIDAHQHFWDLNRFQYPWMPADADSPLRRNFLPMDFKPKLERDRFDGSIAVQATTEPRRGRLAAGSRRRELIFSGRRWVG